MIGAGLAGLAASLSLSRAGKRVTIHEAGPAAGGRCRAYFDRELGLTIDNGNHLLLSGNTAAAAYIEEIGSRSRIHVPAEPAFPFVDARTRRRWTLRPNRGRVPWWIFRRDRRVPGTRAIDYLRLMAITRVRDDRSVAQSLAGNPLYVSLIEPLAIAVLNTRPEAGLARLLGAVVRETLMVGGRACVPLFPRQDLSDSLIEPAVQALRSRGAEIRFGRRVSALTVAGDRVAALIVGGETIPVRSDEAILLAVPPWVAQTLLPDITAPERFEAILNIHFRFDAPSAGGDRFVGIIGGVAEWVFVKPGHVSVTISAANRLVDEAPESIAARVWRDVGLALGIDGPMPPYRVIKERRATFAATADQEARRPPARTGLANLALAGDWTATGLPATIEGAIRSGRSAAHVLLTS